MRKTLGIVAVGLTMLLAASVAVVPAASAQDPAGAADTGLKRKVKSKVVPEYPALAKQLNIAGKVKIEAVIAADGHVISTRVVGGSPLLVNAAVDALKKWRFESAPRDSTEVVEFEFGT